MNFSKFPLYDNESSIGELVTVTVRRSDNDTKVELMEQLADFLEDHSYPSHTGSMYDCTGMYFRSNWEMLNIVELSDRWVVTYKHEFSVDI